MRKKSQRAADFGSWLLQWFLISLAVGVFTVGALMMAKVINQRVWIVFAADGVFCLLIWRLCRLFRRYGFGSLYREKAIPLAVAMLILFILIAMATFGVAVMYDKFWVMLNVYIFPITAIATLIFSMVPRIRTY